MPPDWYEREQPLHVALVVELRRLKRRAQSRLWLVLVAAALVTAPVVWSVARKPAQHRARVILAITEGDLSAGFDPAPLGELRDYIATVLLSNDKLLRVIEARDLFPLRKTHGDEYALAELRDMFAIAVWRNYFQYQHSFDERRTARVAVVFTHTDRDFAYEMAQTLTTIIIEGEGERRVEAARALADQTAEVAAAARRRVDEVRLELNATTLALTQAEARGDTAEAAVLRLRAAELNLEVARVHDAYMAVEQATTMEALQAEVTAAGLALQIDIVDERRPPEPEGSRTTGLIMVGVFAFMVFLPIAGILIGAFDARVHDADDVARLQLPVLGHVPGFTGDQVGSLAARGVPRARMKGLLRWR